LISYVQVNAFVGEGFLGNPAAVCALTEWLPDLLMQKIAAKIGLSETAFFVPEGERFRLRWFTPVTEVELCGHATLASAFVLFEKLKIQTVDFITQSGLLSVSAKGQWITLDFPSRSVTAAPLTPLLLEALGESPKDVYVTDNGITMCVFDNEEQIRCLQPNFQKIKLLKQCLLITAPGKKSDFVSRYFAPNEGIPEDPVTGSAHCVLAPFWGFRFKNSKMKAHQLSKRGGELHCEVTDSRVFISGRAEMSDLRELSL
jgi:PhzF family phenazine biosynthesis protein